MRFPSLVTLSHRAEEVLRRFPWTIGVGGFAAATAILATTHGASEHWARVAMVGALGLPLTVALTLLAEERGWPAARSAALNLCGLVLLALFYLGWPGPDRKHEAIRYLQLNAGLHLLVAVVPFFGQRETNAFWQYNRRLFLGFLRAVVFSAVLFLGLAIALLALDKLFGVNVPVELYGRMYLVIIFVVNTWIFLAEVPRGLRELVDDITYPRVLKVFAQYVLTPLVFIYLLLLLAYLVKIVAGGEWPSGWIGWLVTSVAIAGLLGFLLVHPLRDDPGESWIRTYTRWLFAGLVPAAIVLLVAFWKRVLPYGLTELRLLGVLLGFWLLAIAVSYSLRQDAGIKRIPVTLAALLLLTLYGPFSVTSISVASQGRRLKRLVAARPGEQAAEGRRDAREASAALVFLLEHGAQRQVATAIPGQLPKFDWDSLATRRDKREKAAAQILAVADVPYLPSASTSGGYIYLTASPETATPIRGYDWMLRISDYERTPVVIEGDTVRVRFDTLSGTLGVGIGADTLRFDLRELATRVEAENPAGTPVPPGRLRMEATSPRRRSTLALESLNGRRQDNSVMVQHWQGRLFLGVR